MTDREGTEMAIKLLISYTFPKLSGHIRVERRPRASYRYHVKRLIHTQNSPDRATILVRTPIKVNCKRDVETVNSIARACLEIHEGRTTAVHVSEGRFQA
jgi:hypothetical protein